MSEEDNNTLSDDLAAAWDEAEEAENEGLPEPAAEAHDTDDTDSGPEGGTPEPDDADGVPELQEPVQAAEAGADTPSVEEDKAPPGLAPAAREAWKDVPDSVKAEIRKREQDYERGIVKYADNAKRAEAMDKTLAPYQQFFAMNGGAAQTIPGVLQSAALLQMGSPQQKAQTTAQLIQQFGVNIRMLDELLVGEKPTQAEPDVNQLVDQRMQAWQQQQAQASRKQQEAGIADEIGQFANDPKNEFYRDVADDMADIMDIAARRGKDLSLKDAYDRACSMNPQISQIIQARQAQQTTAQKVRAAASISGGPGGPGDSAPPDSLRGALEEAWDTAGRT